MAFFVHDRGADREIEITQAQCVPVWIEQRGTRRRLSWHYRPFPAAREEPIWHVRARYKDNGKAVNSNKLLSVWGYGIKATGGREEIVATCEALNPGDAEKRLQWANNHGTMLGHFPMVDPSDIAPRPTWSRPPPSQTHKARRTRQWKSRNE